RGGPASAAGPARTPPARPLGGTTTRPYDGARDPPLHTRRIARGRAAGRRDGFPWNWNSAQYPRERSSPLAPTPSSGPAFADLGRSGRGRCPGRPLLEPPPPATCQIDHQPDHDRGRDSPLHLVHDPADVVEVLAELVAERDDDRHGDHRAEHVGGEELPETHARGAGEEEDRGTQTRSVPAHHDRPEAMPLEMNPELLLALFREYPAGEPMLVRPGTEAADPVVDEQVADDHAEVAGRERRPV